jgi:hypothetical protein
LQAAASNLEKDPQEMASATRREHSVSLWSMLNRKDVSFLPHYIGWARPEHYIAVCMSDCVPGDIGLLQLADFLSAWVMASKFYQKFTNKFQGQSKKKKHWAHEVPDGYKCTRICSRKVRVKTSRLLFNKTNM